MSHNIFSSDGLNLKFEDSDNDLLNQYKEEERKLNIKYYKLLRERNGIYATNQGIHVNDVKELNDWDSKHMETISKEEEK